MLNNKNVEVLMLSHYDSEKEKYKRHHIYKVDAVLADFLLDNNLAVISNHNTFNKMLKIKYK